MKKLLVRGIFLLMMALMGTACSEDKVHPELEENYHIVEREVITEDLMTVTSSLPAYVSAYNYTGFGKALVDRLGNRVASMDEDNVDDITTVVVHSSQIPDMDEDQVSLLIAQLLLGKNIVLVEPTLDSFTGFCDLITDIYVLFSSTEEGKEMLEELDVVPGIRQTFEAFYEISNNPEKINDMFLLNTDTDGVFAEALAIRGCDFHLVESLDAISVTESVTKEVDQETGKVTVIENDTAMQPAEITPYTYGTFADMLVEWVNEQKDYIEEIAALKQRSMNQLNSRAEAQKFSLDEICTAQKVEYTTYGHAPVVNTRLPITVSFEICSVYREEDNSDYYCIYKKITSYNQLLNCGPTDAKSWNTYPGFGGYVPFGKGPFAIDVWVDAKCYGPYMTDIVSQSICHTDSEDFSETGDGMVIMPEYDKIKPVDGIKVVNYSPKNSIGSVDKTSGFSYGFDGGLYLASDPSVNLGFSISYDASTTQTIDNLEIVASTVDGGVKWNYNGNNLPVGKAGIFPSHTLAPDIMTRECEVDQSWIWKVPNPSGSYRIYDKTEVHTALHYILNLVVYTVDNYSWNYNPTIRSFRMAPPPRCEQRWMMDVAPYSEELNTMLATTHAKYWKADDHEFKLADTTDDSRITIQQFINDFEQDLENKKRSWQSRGFEGPYTFTFYKVGDADAVYELIFTVK